jgi:hypothetical protein
MALTIPDDKQRLLLVEGKEDKEFFIRLRMHLQLLETVHIHTYDGKDKLGDVLLQVLNSAGFRSLTHIGIVRDADYNKMAFQSVQTALQNANRLSGNPNRQFDIPTQVMSFTGGNPGISVLILPDDSLEGMLEDVILAAFQHDPLITCVTDFVNCVEQELQEVARESIPKARMRSFITAKNLDLAHSNRDDREKSYLSDIFHMTWWTLEIWNHSTFDTAKAFLRQLATD